MLKPIIAQASQKLQGYFDREGTNRAARQAGLVRRRMHAGTARFDWMDQRMASWMSNFP